MKTRAAVLAGHPCRDELDCDSLTTATEHARGDETLGRPWSCVCGPCQHARKYHPAVVHALSGPQRAPTEWCSVCLMFHGIELQPCYGPDMDPDGDFAR